MTELQFTPDVYKKLFPQEYLAKCLENGVRPDGRKMETPRPVELKTNVVSTANSSSLVKLGHTAVVAGTKLAVATPAVDTPDQGEIVIQVHLTPLCSSKFSIGRPPAEAHDIASYLTRIVNGSRVVEMSDLGIEKGKSAWRVMLDVYCIDHDGNVYDAALMSVMAALRSLELPAVSINDSDHIVSINPDGTPTRLPMQHEAYSTSFATFNGKLVVDPTSQEEQLATSSFSLSYTTKGFLCSVRKPGGTPIEASTLEKCMTTAKRRTVQCAQHVEEHFVAN